MVEKKSLDHRFLQVTSDDLYIRTHFLKLDFLTFEMTLQKSPYRFSQDKKGQNGDKIPYDL